MLWNRDLCAWTLPEEKMATSIPCRLQRSPAQILFLSDIAAELDAARTAGMQTALCVRGPGLPNSPGPHQVIRTFDQVSGAPFAGV